MFFHSKEKEERSVRKQYLEQKVEKLNQELRALCAEDPETQRRLHQKTPDSEKLTENEKKKKTSLLIKRLRQQLSVVKKKVKSMSIELEEFKAEARILGDK